jgi:hypothetical protein
MKKGPYRLRIISEKKIINAHGILLVYEFCLVAVYDYCLIIVFQNSS